MEFNLLLNQCLPHVLYDQEIKYNVQYGDDIAETIPWKDNFIFAGVIIRYNYIVMLIY